MPHVPASEKQPAALRGTNSELAAKPKRACAGKQTAVADAVEAVRQYVDEEAADELGAGERHDLGPLAALGAVVLPLEGDCLAIERDQPAVGDGDAMGIARQVGEHGFGSAEWTLAVDDPLAALQRSEIICECLRVGERGMIAKELEAAGLVHRDQHREE